MGDLGEDSEDATSSIGDEERVRRLFQACDGDGDGFIDCHDLLNICRELNLEESVDDLMRELGADEHGRICYREFLRRRTALRPEIDALKASQPTQTDYLPTSSENSVGEGKLSWEFDSGARDLSPEPTQQPASGNLLELANKLHAAALASLKAEILDLTNRLQIAIQERDHFEKTAHKAEAERRKLEKRLHEEAQSNEEQLTELHSVIAELSKINLQQRSMVIPEEETSEAEEPEVVPIDSSPTQEVEAQSDVSSDHPEVEVEPEEAKEDDDDLAQQLTACQADNAMLQERLNRALQDLETISQLNAKKTSRESAVETDDMIRVARVASPACVLERATPSLVEKLRAASEYRRIHPHLHDGKLEGVDLHITGFNLSAIGVCRTEVAEALVASVQEASDCQELEAAGKEQVERLAEQLERTRAELEHVKAQGTVMSVQLEDAYEQVNRLYLLTGKYESNAIALSLALNSCDSALEVAEALLCLLETELGLVLANSRPHGEDDKRFVERAIESRRQAERHACEVLRKSRYVSASSSGDWAPADEGCLRDLLAALKDERNTCRSTYVTLETTHVDPLPVSDESKKKLDLENALLMQEVMCKRQERKEMKKKYQLLEKERTSQDLRMVAQRSQMQAALQTARQLQSQLELCDSVKERITSLVRILEGLTATELRGPEALAVDLRAANSSLMSTLERCKKKHHQQLQRLQGQMDMLTERHANQVKSLRQEIRTLQERNYKALHPGETNI